MLKADRRWGREELVVTSSGGDCLEACVKEESTGRADDRNSSAWALW